MSITLYHYTDSASANSINMSKIMYRSTDTIADAVWGIGVYFTDMDPNNFTADQIAFNNWRQPLSPAIGRKLEYCIVVTFQKSDIQNCCGDGRRIFLYPGRDVNLNLHGHRVIKTNFGTNSSYQGYYK